MIKILQVLLLLCNTPIFANTINNDFVDFFATTNNFQADFIQEIDDETTRGVLSVMRPKSIKWHTKTPDEKIVILHNNKITSYDVWLQSANIIDYKPNALVEFLTTKPKDLTRLPSFLTEKNGIKYYELKNIIFGFKNKILAEIIATNNIDKQIYIKFNNLIKNITKKQDFILNFPEEVDILDESSFK